MAQSRSRPPTPPAGPTAWPLLGDWINIVISRVDIEAGDFGDLRVVVEALAEPAATRAYHSRVSLYVHGYDHDPRELYEIDAARDYLCVLAQNAPWSHYLQPRDPMLRILILCLAGAERTGSGQAQAAPERVRHALDVLARTAVQHLQRQGASQREIDTAVRDVYLHAPG